MGTPALVLGDRITGICPNHLIPSATGTQPAGPLPFSAPLTMGLVNTVIIGGKAAAVMGSSGVNTPPHPGIVDGAFVSPSAQVGRIASGSSSVLIGGKPAANVQSQALCCVATGKGAPGVPTVLIG
jgi:uncharacterized Zn-binding protein involved in type VI secretion